MSTAALLDDIADATRERADAQAVLDGADAAWRTAIRAALAGGTRVVDVMEVAGCSRPRVYQIRDGKR